MMSISTSVVILLSLSFVVTKAFVPGHRKTFDATRFELQSVLMAKKVRRKRKDGDAIDNAGVSAPETALDFDDLPEFTLESDLPEEYSKEISRKVASSSIDRETPRMKAQMGGSVKPLSSLSDLLNDRSLEAQLNFDEPVDAEPLPSLSEFVKAGGAKGEVIGKKKARQQERRAAAIAAADVEEEDGGFFSNLPFFGAGKDKDSDEDKEINPIKLLESGTWACIYILVAWEVYLNSPLFERAAPMAPIVYDSLPSL
ncbi:hypothetical protein MHU86_3096 [Fragilaria crotonensis]|nr:hypothetical protein MHU86_3096 [Fragilaria crotonensis]